MAVFRRLGQRVGERVGTATKTGLDSELETAIFHADAIHECVQQLMSKIKMPKPTGLSKIEDIGNVMKTYATRFSNVPSLANEMSRGMELENRMGQHERELAEAIDEQIIKPLKSWETEEYKPMVNQKKALERTRLDMDACQNKVRKSKGGEQHSALEAKLQAATELHTAEEEKLRSILENVPQWEDTLASQIAAYITIQCDYYAQASKIMAK